VGLCVCVCVCILLYCSVNKEVMEWDYLSVFFYIIVWTGTVWSGIVCVYFVIFWCEETEYGVGLCECVCIFFWSECCVLEVKCSVIFSVHTYIVIFNTYTLSMHCVRALKKILTLLYYSNCEFVRNIYTGCDWIR
jgi:hypothetical protein